MAERTDTAAGAGVGVGVPLVLRMTADPALGPLAGGPGTTLGRVTKPSAAWGLVTGVASGAAWWGEVGTQNQQDFLLAHSAAAFASGAASAAISSTQPVASVELRQKSRSFPVTELPPDSFVDQYVIVPQGSTMNLREVTVTPILPDEDLAPNLCAQVVLDPEGAEDMIYSQCSATFRRAGPLAQLNAVNQSEVAALRLDNTADQIVRATASFDYTFEQPD